MGRFPVEGEERAGRMVRPCSCVGCRRQREKFQFFRFHRSLAVEFNKVGMTGRERRRWVAYLLQSRSKYWVRSVLGVGNSMMALALEELKRGDPMYLPDRIRRKRRAPPLERGVPWKFTVGKMEVSVEWLENGRLLVGMQADVGPVENLSDAGRAFFRVATRTRSVARYAFDSWASPDADVGPDRRAAFLETMGRGTIGRLMAEADASGESE